MWSLLIFVAEMFLDIWDGQFDVFPLLDFPIIALKASFKKVACGSLVSWRLDDSLCAFAGAI